MAINPIQPGAIPPAAIPFGPLPKKIGKPDDISKSKSPSAIRTRKRIAQEYGVEVLDTDVHFSGAEVEAIEETLKEIKGRKRQHLIGVRRIVKNRKERIKLIQSADLHAFGAYEPNQKTIFLFDNINEHMVPEVVTHEVGHAVHYFNMEFHKFMEFVALCGYNMTEFRKFFVPGNEYYQFGVLPKSVPLDQWPAVMSRFSMTSLSHNSDIFGDIHVEKPGMAHRKNRPPWEANPLEQFAWAYEWFHRRAEDFEQMADVAEKAGDPTWKNRWKFLQKEIFGEESRS